MDSHLNWKYQIQYISKKIKRNIGILSKLCHFVTLSIFTQLYHTLIYPFLTYAVMTWGNTYSSTLQPSTILRKRVARIIKFSKFDAHSTPLLTGLKFLNLLI